MAPPYKKEVNEMEIGQRLKAFRKQKKLSQTDLANLMGKSLRTIQKYESGEIELSVQAAFSAAEHLEVSPACILGIENIQKDGPSFYDLVVQELDNMKALDLSSNDELLKVAAALTVLRDYLKGKK